MFSKYSMDLEMCLAAFGINYKKMDDEVGENRYLIKVPSDLVKEHAVVLSLDSNNVLCFCGFFPVPFTKDRRADILDAINSLNYEIPQFTAYIDDDDTFAFSRSQQLYGSETDALTNVILLIKQSKTYLDKYLGKVVLASRGSQDSHEG